MPDINNLRSADAKLVLAMVENRSVLEKSFPTGTRAHCRINGIAFEVEVLKWKLFTLSIKTIGQVPVKNTKTGHKFMSHWTALI